MSFEYFNNFCNTTASTTITTQSNTNTTGLNTKTTICPRKVNICHSNVKAAGIHKKCCSCFTKIRNEKRKAFVVTTTLRASTRLHPLELKRKIRKTSRRKRRRRYESCLQNKTIANSVVGSSIAAATTSTTTLSPAAATKATTLCSSHKCKLTVNNTRTLNCIRNNKYSKLHFCTLGGISSICRWCCSSNTINTISSCDKSYCKYYCKCSCSRKKLKLIVKNIVSLLMMPQTTIVNKVANLAHATTTTTSLTTNQYFTNNLKRKRYQLDLKREKFMQLNNLCALGKEQQIAQNILPKLATTVTSKTTTTPSCTNCIPPATLATAVTTSFLTPSSSSALPSTRPGTNSNNFSTFLTDCTLPSTSEATTTTNNLTSIYYSRSSPSATSSSSSSSLPTWHSVIWLTPARILNELFGVIFMTLLVFSICHNNVLETSAASIKVTRRDVVASSVVAVEQIITPNKNSIAASRLNERQYKRQHPPEHLTQQYHQKLTQTSSNNDNINNNRHYHQHQQQSQTYLNQKEVQLRPLEYNMEEDKSNHIFQPQLETWPTYKQHERDHQQQQQHLTTEATILSHDAELETSYNNTFQSLSIIDGDLTLAVDASQNLMTIEEEMLIAASGGAVGVGSNAVGLSHHLHDSNGDLGSFDTAIMGFEGFDGLAHNGEKSSMPIFDFGMPRNITARTGHTEAIIKCRVDRLDDKSVSWIRKRDLHILTVGTATYTSDKRFQVTESKDSREWTLHVKSPQARDSGIYECQVNTEPKMSMAFQLNVIEISPDAKAVITGPADLHFKVGSAIILTCIVHQPSVKDIGPIYWYRGEYMITPFDINESTQEESAFPLAAAATPSQTMHNKLNVLEQNHHHQPSDGSYGGATVGIDTEQMPQITTNEITQDFAQRIAMESQLGDTMKSRLRISNAQTSDTGNYTCQPTTASSASVMVHVINDENPAAMQKSGTNHFLFKNTKFSMSLVAATTLVAISTSSAFY